MTLSALAQVLAVIPDGESLTFTIKKDVLQRAVEMARGGPAVLSTVQAAKLFGYTAERWARWAKTGTVIGAYRDDLGRWRLPNQSCRALMRQLAKGGMHAPKADAALGTEVDPATVIPFRHRVRGSNGTQNTSRRRGPRALQGGTR